MKVTKQTFSTFTKEGVSRKYYTSFCIHIQPSYEIKLMQILFEVTVQTLAGGISKNDEFYFFY